MRRSSAGVSSRHCHAHRVAGRRVRGRVKCWPSCAASIASATRASARTSSSASEGWAARGALRAARPPPSVLLAPVALALLDLAHHLDPVRELAQVGTRGVAGAGLAGGGGGGARGAEPVGVEALLGLRRGILHQLEHRALVI